ncbi:PREDICTED: uncharacterized protein LOC107084430 [Cyprinodon variegatus]|uniref:uncharacterized protein LOC107084430 n=1 Tax=Cyprinodon variegatus TaxID=28743 RepID=UPI000742B6C6|nr:PREDICTED: uncharacterized protein LOC107084430 [Cyprinodon variegatus]
MAKTEVKQYQLGIIRVSSTLEGSAGSGGGLQLACLSPTNSAVCVGKGCISLPSHEGGWGGLSLLIRPIGRSLIQRTRSSLHPWGLLAEVPHRGSIIVLEEFNAHAGKNSGTSVSSIGWNEPPALNPRGGFCASNGLSIMNAMFSHKGVNRCTWHWDTIGWRLMIYIVSSEHQMLVLDTRVKREAELSTYHHLVELEEEELSRPNLVVRERLVEPSVRAVFNSHLQGSFMRLQYKTWWFIKKTKTLICKNWSFIFS